MKPHDHPNLEKERFIWADGFRRVRLHDGWTYIADVVAVVKAEGSHLNY